MIDVRDLIANHAAEEHARRADAYFSALPADTKLLRKPFFGIQDTPYTLYGVSEVLRRLALFPGAVVVDFGAGTGWLSRILAQLDCCPIALDVSAVALALGQTVPGEALPIGWRAYDGATLPLDDASVDRVVCFDSFHHVPDQRAVLAEFHRVLRPGGRVVLHEPGPEHSRQAQSQFEMRQHGVIENDIVLEDIWPLARAAGFDNLQVAAALPVTPTLTMDGYDRLLAGEPGEVAVLLQALRDGGYNLRIFSLDKGAQVTDSRHGGALGGAIEVRIDHRDKDRMRGHVRATNTGAVHWRPSVFETGGVFIGVKMADPWVSGDFARIPISAAGVAPGETVEAAFDIMAPQRFPATATFDLVAENVTWFEPFGSTPIIIQFEEL